VSGCYLNEAARDEEVGLPGGRHPQPLEAAHIGADLGKSNCANHFVPDLGHPELLPLRTEKGCRNAADLPRIVTHLAGQQALVQQPVHGRRIALRKRPYQVRLSGIAFAEDALFRCARS